MKQQCELAILFHYTVNFSREMLHMTNQGYVIRLIVFKVFVMVVEVYDKLNTTRKLVQ